MQRFLPGYEQQIIDGGLNVTAGAPKMVGHTTETRRGSLQALISSWDRNPGAGCPHFIIEGRRVVQLIPLDRAAYTLRNLDGGADTNRAGPAIQFEVVSDAANDWDDDTYESVGNLLADVKAAGHDFDLDNFTRFYGANEGIVLAVVGSPIRFSAHEYVWFNGWTDHAHCPENDHWDIGKKDGRRIHRIARARYGGGIALPPPPTITKDWFDMATEDDLRRVIRDEFSRNQEGSPAVQLNGSLWTVEDDGERITRRWIPGTAQLDMLRQIGVVRDSDPIDITPETEVAFVSLPAVPNPGNPF